MCFFFFCLASSSSLSSPSFTFTPHPKVFFSHFFYIFFSGCLSHKMQLLNNVLLFLFSLFHISETFICLFIVLCLQLIINISFFCVYFLLSSFFRFTGFVLCSDKKDRKLPHKQASKEQLCIFYWAFSTDHKHNNCGISCFGF